MALSGSISDWSLADILQMVAAERKSGVLTLNRESEEIRLDFREGHIVGAHDRNRAAKDKGRRGAGRGRTGSESRGARPLETQPEVSGLSAYLGVTGRITSEQVPILMRQAEAFGGDQFQAACGAGLFPPAALEEALNEYAQELLHRVLAWPSGDYHFVANTPVGPTPSVVLSTDGLLLEGMRRIDEAPRIQEVVRPEIVFQGTGVKAPATLTDREVGVLALLDGRPAGKIARAAHLTDYDAAKVLFKLHEMGLIAHAPDHEDEEVQPVVLDLSLEELEPTPRRGRLVRTASLVVLCIVSLGFRELSHRPGFNPALKAQDDPRLLQSVQLARTVYVEAHGRDPESARDLRRAGLLPGGYWGQAAQIVLMREIERDRQAGRTDHPEPASEAGDPQTELSK